MNETLTQVSGKITERWSDLNSSQRIKVLGGFAAVLGAIILAVVTLSQPTMVPLYTGLDLAAAAQVTEVLETQGIEHTLLNGGTTIHINEKDLSSTKILLARENVPQGRYTFADAITNGMSTTESDRNAKLNYYDETKLETDLASMEGVKAASVTLSIPEEKNSFLASKQKSSASVMLTLYENLSQAQVDGIAKLVASSVYNLSLADITIVDSTGRTLYDGSKESDPYSTTNQQSIKQSEEQGVKSKILEFLGPIYDEITISSNLVFDFDQQQITSEEYTSPILDSDRGILVSEHLTEGSATNQLAEATPGVEANDGNPALAMGEGSTGESNYSTANNQYNINKSITSQVKNVGTINYAKSSIAVNVFNHRIYNQEFIEGTLPEGTTWEMFKEENSAEIPLILEPAILEGIQKGTGISDVVVYGYEKPIFIDTIPYEINPMDWIPFVLLVIIGIIVLGIMLKFKKPEEIIDLGETIEMPDAVFSDIRNDTLATIEEREDMATKKQIDKFVDEKPEAVASLLRSWLNEDD
ncbi:flagellar M-ring protein FliF [Candidatus Epulonipiscium fishelsonii]|nr:flagellar M-ring protein FliF [Epulopiscium sp. SCG-C06WGA-EpuloA1]